MLADDYLEAKGEMPELKLTFDSWNAASGGDPAESFRRCASDVVHAHYKDRVISDKPLEGYRQMLDGHFYRYNLCRLKFMEVLMKPNILLIVTEQHRGDSLGCESHPVLLTPNMDEIAARGVRFRRFYSDCPVCMPARRTMLSGQFPATHGLLSNAEGVEWEPEATLPQILRDSGYQTRWIGRSMHQFPKRARFGYEEVELGGYAPGSDYTRWFKQNAPDDCGGWFGGGVMHNDWTARPWPLPEYLHRTNWTVQRALEFLQRRDPACPFFLTLSFGAAHPPLQPPEFYFNRYLRTGVPEPHIGEWAEPPEGNTGVSPNRINLKGEALLNARAGYYGLINHLDDQLRRILNPVTGIRHNSDTIVCLTSDHGEMLGDHYRWRKQVPYEGSARVPFLLSAPDGMMDVERGTAIDEPATLADLMPTLLDMAEVEIPDTVDGKSLVPILRGRDALERDCVHTEHGGSWHALTDGHEKYVWHADSGAEQLFNLGKDPHELHDLSDIPRCENRMEHWRKCLASLLKDRPEGFSDGAELFAGRPTQTVLSHAGPPSDARREKFFT